MQTSSGTWPMHSTQTETRPAPDRSSSHCSIAASASRAIPRPVRFTNNRPLPPEVLMRSHFPRIAPLALSLALVFASAVPLSGCDRSAHLSVEEHIERAKDFQSKGDTRASFLELKNAVQTDPNNAQARWLLGNAYLVLRLGGEAETQLDKAVKLGINPKSARIPVARAQLYQNKNQQKHNTQPAVDTEEPGILVQILDLRGNALLGLSKYPV